MKKTILLFLGLILSSCGSGKEQTFKEACSTSTLYVTCQSQNEDLVASVRCSNETGSSQAACTLGFTSSCSEGKIEVNKFMAAGGQNQVTLISNTTQKRLILKQPAGKSFYILQHQGDTEDTSSVGNTLPVCPDATI